MHAKVQLGIAALCLVLTYPSWVVSPAELLAALRNHAAVLQELAHRGASSAYYADHRARLHDDDLAILLSSGSISSVCGLVAGALRWISHPIRHLAWLVWILTAVGTLAVARHPADDGVLALLISRWPHVDGRFLSAALLGGLGLLSSISAHVHHRSRWPDEFGG